MLARQYQACGSSGAQGAGHGGHAGELDRDPEFSLSASVIGIFIAGVALLIVGGELLVRGASRLAAAAGVSPLVVGLTVVALGTSSPEIGASLTAGLRGESDLAFGNVVGSNLLNLLFVLGLSALLVPLTVAQKIVRADVPIMILSTFLVSAFALNQHLTRLEGMLLLLCLGAYLVFTVRQARRESQAIRLEYEKVYGGKRTGHHGAVLTNIALILLGLALLVLGARWLVDGATAIARALGVSELIIGLTIVAVGTSMPEAVTSMLAARRGERDIAVGNIVGSNIFNLLAVLGITALFAPNGVVVARKALHFDVPVMIVASLACLPIFLRGRIARWEGGLLFGYYLAYVIFLILDATQAAALPQYAQVMLFVVPLSLVTLVVAMIRTLRARRRAAAK